MLYRMTTRSKCGMMSRYLLFRYFKLPGDFMRRFRSQFLRRLTRGETGFWKAPEKEATSKESSIHEKKLDGRLMTSVILKKRSFQVLKPLPVSHLSEATNCLHPDYFLLFPPSHVIDPRYPSTQMHNSYIFHSINHHRALSNTILSPLQLST